MLPLTLFACLYLLAMPGAQNGPHVAVDVGIRVYVSTDGDDRWTGALPAPNARRTDGPLATLTAARDVVRRARRPISPDVSAVILVRGGVYRLASPLTLGHEDSYVTIAAYRNERAILSGGVVVSGWQPVADGLWRASAAAVPAGWFPTELYAGERRVSRAALPAAGFYTIAAVAPPTPASAGKGFDRFQYAPGDLDPRWRNLRDVEVLCIHVWSASRLRIASVDDATHTVTFTGPTNSTASWASLRKGGRYRVENVWDGLKTPGSWYFDGAERALYYRPLPGENVRHEQFTTPVVQELVHLAGDPAHGGFVRGVRFNGIAFEHAGWSLPPAGYSFPQAEVALGAALEGEGAQRCGFSRCTFAHLGRYAVELGTGCSRNDLAGCLFRDLGAGGIKIGPQGVPTGQPEYADGNTVEDCDISAVGRVHPAAVGIWIGQSAGNTITHNAIHDLYYTGISMGWTWGYGPSHSGSNTVAYNEVYRVGQGLLSDMGAIYTLGAQQGTHIHHNLFHDVLSYDYGGWGIYFDEGTSGVLADHNIVYNTKSGGFHQHYGRENVVHSNVFAFGTTAQLQRTRDEDHVSFTFDHNIVYWITGDLLAGNWSSPEHFHMEDNLYWDASHRPVQFAGKSFDDWRREGEDVHSLIADPGFRDPGAFHFSFGAGSPAASLGIEPIDLAGVGPRGRRAVASSDAR